MTKAAQKFSLKFLGVITIFIFFSTKTFSQQTIPVIDALQWDFQNDLFFVKGPCLYFKEQLIDPSLDSLPFRKGNILSFPTLVGNSGKEDGATFGTFQIKIVIPHSGQRLALYLPQMYSSYNLWINRELLVSTGTVSKTKEQSKPQWLVRSVSFECETDTLDLFLQVANFHHAKAGIKENILLGTESKIAEKHRIDVVANISEVVILILIGLVFILGFIFSQQKSLLLYFALMSITWAVRSLFSNQYLYAQYDPDIDWNLLVRMEYITLFLMVIWATLVISDLYEEEANNIVKYFLVICNAAFIIHTFIREPREFTQWLGLYLGVSAVLILYVTYIGVRALIQRKSGSLLLGASILIGAFIFGYDLVVYKLQMPYNPVIFSLGYIAIFVLLGLNLGLHINIPTSKTSSSSL